MENKPFTVGSGHNNNIHPLYGLEQDQAWVPNLHQDCYQAEFEGALPEPPECNFGEVLQDKSLTRNGQHTNFKELSFAFDQSHLQYSIPTHASNDPGQGMGLRGGGVWEFVGSKEHSRLDGVEDGHETIWQTIGINSQELDSPFTQNIPGTLYNSFVPILNSQRHEDWVAGIYCPQNYLDPHSIVNIAPAKYPTSNLLLHENTDVSHQKFCSPVITPPVIGYGPTEFSSFYPSNSQSTVAAQRAVADLFPELSDTCNRLEVKTPSRFVGFPEMKFKGTKESAPILYSNETDIPKKTAKRRCTIHYNQDTVKEQPKSGLPTSKISMISEIRGKIPECMEQEQERVYDKQASLLSFQSFPFENTVQANQSLQPSSDLGGLHLENSDYSNNLGIKNDGSSLAVTISPRCLSKLHSPSMSPEPSAFCFQEGRYENIANHMSETTLYGSKEFSKVAEGDVPGALCVETGFNSPGFDDCESNSSTPSTPEIPTTPSLSRSLPPLPINIPSSSSSSPLLFPTRDNITLCRFPSPQNSPSSPRIKPVKMLSGSRITKRSSKDLLKEQNRLLLLWRSQNISYKTIKERLGIDEAESTLRGRLRTLTKPKNQRLRKPQWMEEDIKLLLEVVDPHLPNIKWKQISETIVNLGGSYRFGPSTCKKQYAKLVASGRVAPLVGCTLGKRSKTDIGIGSPRRSGRKHGI